MDALNTPPQSNPLVSTFFEGEIIDLVHHHFTHRHWKRLQPFHTLILPTILQQHSTHPAPPTSSPSPAPPSSHTAAAHTAGDTSELGAQRTLPTSAVSSRPAQPSSASLLLPPPAPSPLALALSRCRFVFMRWKELHFICGEGGSLSISGYYIIAVDRVTGEVQGYYCDKQKSAA